MRSPNLNPHPASDASAIRPEMCAAVAGGPTGFWPRESQGQAVLGMLEQCSVLGCISRVPSSEVLGTEAGFTLGKPKGEPLATLSLLGYSTSRDLNRIATA